MRERAARSPETAGQVFDLLTSKLRRPVVRPGTVLGWRRRTAGAGRPASDCLGGRAAGLREDDAAVAVGRAQRPGLRVVSVHEGDNDPKVLLTYVAGALIRFSRSTGGCSTRCQPGELGARLCRPEARIRVLVDDLPGGAVQMTCTRCITPNAALRCRCWPSVPPGSRLALAGRLSRRCASRGCAPRAGSWRSAPPICRSPARRRRRCCVYVELAWAAMRWPGCMGGPRVAGRAYLAALYLREGGPLASAAVSFGGDDRLVSEYMESEFLARISRRQRAFLTRTAVLERMSGPLCEAVLDVPGQRRSWPSWPGRTCCWCRWTGGGVVPLPSPVPRHAAGGLQRREPGLVPVLRRRAASWCLANGGPEEALEYSMAAGDADAAAGLMAKLAVQAPAARPDHDHPAVVQVAGGPGRDRGTPDGRGDGLDHLRDDGPASGRPAIVRCGRPLAVRGSRPGPVIPRPRRGPLCCGPSCPGAGSSRCAPTQMRRSPGSRRGAS